MDDYAIKPINPGDLARVLAKWLPSGAGAAKKTDQCGQVRAWDDVPKSAGSPLEDPVRLAQPWELPFFIKGELFRRCMDDADLVRQVLDMILESTPLRIKAVQEFLRMKDFQSLRMEAHAMKGAALNAACPVLAAAARKIERACDAPDVHALKQLLSDLEKHAESTCRALRDCMAHLHGDAT